jgi:hypothetical protein
MPVLRTGPDVAAALLTAERTMTRAGDLNGGIDAGGAIRERPPRCKVDNGIWQRGAGAFMYAAY